MIPIHRLRYLCIAFRESYGHWPRRIVVGPDTFLMHNQGVLGHFYDRDQLGDLLALISRAPIVASVEADDDDYRAEGDLGNQLRYGAALLASDETRQQGLWECWLANSALGIARPSEWLNQVLERPISDCRFTNRTVNALTVNGACSTTRDLATRTEGELCAIRGIGAKALREIAHALFDLGLSFGMNVKDAPANGVTVVDAGPVPESLFPDLDIIDFQPGGEVPARSDADRSACSVRRSSAVVDCLLPDVRAMAEGLKERGPFDGDALARLLYGTVKSIAYETGMTDAAVVRYADALVRACYRIRDGSNVSSSRELQLVLGQLGDGDARAGALCFGLENGHELTLEEAGARMNVSRERVRQLCERFASSARRMRPLLPVTTAVVHALDAVDRPMSLDEWRQCIPEPIRPAAAAELGAIRHLEQWKWTPEHRWIAHERTWLVCPPNVDSAGFEIALAAADESIARGFHWGAVHSVAIARMHELPLSLIRNLLDADDRWCATIDGWFVRRGSTGGVFGRRAHRILTTLGALSVSEIRYSLRRAARRPLQSGYSDMPLPPVAVLERLLIEIGCEPGPLPGTLRVGKSMRKLSRGATDTALLDAFAHGSAAVTTFDLDDAMRTHGLSAASARAAISYSPLLRRVEPCVYTLVGRDAPEAQLVLARERALAASADTRKTHEVLAGGAVRVSYHADRFDPGMATVPNGLVPEGEWLLHSQGSVHRVHVRHNYVTGIARHARRAHRQGATTLSLEFDPTTRSITVSSDAAA